MFVFRKEKKSSNNGVTETLDEDNLQEQKHSLSKVWFSSYPSKTLFFVAKYLEFVVEKHKTQLPDQAIRTKFKEDNIEVDK